MLDTTTTLYGKSPDEVSAALSALVLLEDLEFRQQGKISRSPAQEGKAVRYFARWVPYVKDEVVRARLEQVAPSRWSLTTKHHGTGPDMDGAVVIVVESTISIRLDDGSVIERSNYGEGKSAKAAATDSFKRAALRFGIGHELASRRGPARLIRR
jgi:hypothetical protein